MGVNGVILNTVDGGVTWAQQKSNIKKTLRAVAFLNARKGWAVGESGLILHTTDGGQTWKAQSNVAEQNLLDICVYKNRGWIVGANGTILRLGR